MAKSEYWLKMAEEDLKDASLDIENSRFPSSVFHSQQCAEKVCKAIVNFSKLLESQKESPRYGWETVDKIIMPSEIYDANKAGALFNNAKEVMELGRKFLKGYK
ncbi:MAG: HEPN domain-containing protein [Candidatus Methanoperedens sp.]|nr:HEPN domain-containing protein [Candidatus Methanoperedens sp.]